jgi:hypothetical protein
LGDLFPGILTDILVGISCGDGNLRLALIEVKGPAKSVGLTDYSQLVGYLQVAELIQVGALLLIENDSSASRVSSELKKVINSGRLLLKWTVLSRNNEDVREHQTGICSCGNSGLIDWEETSTIGGLSTSSQFVMALINSRPIGF